MNSYAAVLCALAMLVLVGNSSSAAAQWDSHVKAAGTGGISNCTFSSKLYRPCEDQAHILQEALNRAKSQGQLLIVVFGADWCPYCNKFEASLTSPKLLGDASLANTFTHVNIAVSALSGGVKQDVVSGTNILSLLQSKAQGEAVPVGIPYVAVIDPNSDHHVATFDTDTVEDQSWFKLTTYDRSKLYEALKSARARLAAR